MKKWLLLVMAICLATLVHGAGFAEDQPGVTGTEIKIGNTMPYSGPASIYGTIGRTEAAYFHMLNNQGGLNGRRIVFVSRDDAYSPPKAVEETRKLMEEDGVAFMFGALGTPTGLAVRGYLNSKKIPQLLIGTGADQFLDPRRFSSTLPYNPSYRVEAQIYAKYILRELRNAKIAILYQHDDFGRDYLKGLKDVLGDRYPKLVVKEESYEVSDPTVDSQMVLLQQSGADVLLLIAVPKQTAQALHKAHDLGWHPVIFIDLNSFFVSTLPGMAEVSTGALSAIPYKDVTDPSLASDPDIIHFVEFAKKYLDSKAQRDPLALYGYGVVETMAQILRQCGDDLSRTNVMKQAASLKNFHSDNLLAGITVSSSPSDYRLIKRMRMTRFNGKIGEPIGEIMAAE
jgi:ABC-type branched-subunit amino acid transport system substrate-binding protein